MNWEQQRAQILATIKSKKGKIKSIMTKAATDNRSTSKTEDSDIEALEEDIAKLEKNLKRVENIIADTEKAKDEANPVAGQNSEQAEASYNGDPEPEKYSPSVKVKSNTPKGIAFAQLVKAKALAVLGTRSGNFYSPLEIAKSQGMDPRVVKALVLDTENSSALTVQNQMAGEFVELLRNKTIVDKLANMMRAAPFNQTIPGMATGSTAAWVGEGKPKPATNPTFNTVEIKHHKLAGIVVRTEELLKLSTVSADQMLRDDLVAATAELMDNTFMDEADQDTTRPAGVLHGATKITATGKTVTEYSADLAKLKAAFIKAKLSLSGAYYVMSETRASEMGELRDALGNPYYRGMQAGVNEKTLNGLPVIESETAEDALALIKPSELYLADDAEVSVAYSDQATIDMGSTTLVNLFQENKVAIRAERHITWAKRRTMAAAWIDYSALSEG